MQITSVVGRFIHANLELIENILFIIIIWGTIVLITFATLHFLFKKLWKSNRRKKLTAFIISITMSPFLFYAFLYYIIVLLFTFDSYYIETTFDSNVWKENSNERYKMSNDIITSDTLLSMSKDEIINLLGRNSKSKVELETSNRWIYNMGSHGWGFRIKIYSLELKFDNNKVIQVKQLELLD